MLAFGTFGRLQGTANTSTPMTRTCMASPEYGRERFVSTHYWLSVIRKDGFAMSTTVGTVNLMMWIALLKIGNPMEANLKMTLSMSSMSWILQIFAPKSRNGPNTSPNTMMIIKNVMPFGMP